MVILSKSDYSFYNKFKKFSVFRKEVDKWNGKVIKRTNSRKNGKYLYYLCNLKGTDSNDAFVFDEGIFLGASPDDIEIQDVKIIL